MPRTGGDDGSSGILATHLSDPTIRPEQEPTDHADQPDEHHLKPARQRRGVHDQVNGKEINRRSGPEDNDVEDRSEYGVGQAPKPGARRSQKPDRSEDRRCDDRPPEDQKADEYENRGSDIEHSEEQRRQDCNEPGTDAIHSLFALQIAICLRILSLDLLSNLHPCHAVCAIVARCECQDDLQFVADSAHVNDFESYRTGPYLTAVGLSADPKSPRSQFL